MFLHNLRNVLLQIINERGLQKEPTEQHTEINRRTVRLAANEDGAGTSLGMIIMLTKQINGAHERLLGMQAA
jgi:hypothetical protein